jgi:serine/threonine-protein kinase
MAIGGSTHGATRAKDGSKGAAGRFTFLVEAARGYLGALWLSRDAEDNSDDGVAYVRHVAPLVAASARAAILDGARWSLGGADSDRFQIFEARGAVDLVTPFVDGEVLRTLLRTAAVKHASAEPALLLGMVRALAEQLEAVHERALSTKSPHGFGGVHPDGIIVDVRGGVHLLDVGAAAAASSREPWRSDPQRIGYSAPEQLEARAVVDQRTDVFAVGIFLWEALANRRLFPGNDAKSARERVQKANIPRLDATRASASPGIAKEIADVVARCLERAPGARFQSVGELLKAVRGLDPAPPERVGAWVTTLADAAIGKRRQILERAAAGALTGEERLTLPPASIRPAARADSPSTSRPPAKPSSLPAPAPRPSSMPAPRPSSAAPAAGRSANGAPLAPRSGGTLPGPTPPPPSARPASLAGAPPPPSARGVTMPPRASSGAPPPPSARTPTHAATATPLPPSARTPTHAATATPLPPSARAAAHAIAAPLPPSARAAAHANTAPLPPSARAATVTPIPPRTRNATTTPVSGAPLPPSEAITKTPAAAEATPQAPEGPSPDAAATDAPRADLASPIAEESPPQARADSAEALEPESADDEADADVEDDVEDDEPSPQDPTVSKRPPPLPHEGQALPDEAQASPLEAHALPLAALAGPIGTRSSEAPANPIQINQLATLTAAPPPVALPRSAVVAALVSLLALGAFVLYRHHSRSAANEPRIERTVQTPPVRIEEPLSAVPASPSPPPAATGPAPAETAHTAPAATAPATPPPTTPAEPAAEAPPPKAETAQKPPAARPRTAAAEAPRHPPSHEPMNTGFKPGGI